MRKKDLISGIIYTGLGAAALLAAVLTDSAIDAVLCGLAGGFGFTGICMIVRYFYWSSPKRQEEYRKRLDAADIEIHDELKIKIRDKAGRYAYVLGLMLLSFSMLLIALLGAAGKITGFRFMVFYLGGLLAVQIAAGYVIFNKLLQRYS